MRFGQALGEIIIPEWKECYLNYQILKIFVAIIKSSVQGIQQCDKAIDGLAQQHISNPSSSILAAPSQELEYLSPASLEALKLLKKQLNDKLHQANRLFYHTFFVQTEIVEMFYQMKVLQIEDRFRIIHRLRENDFDKEKMDLYLTYIEYAYVEISYLGEMREANLEAQRKILKKHKKYAKKLVPTPTPSHDKISRMACIQEDYTNKIEDLYVSQNIDLESKDARQFLRLAAQQEQTSKMQYFFMGLGVGASFIVLGTLIFIILNQGLQVENNSMFARDFVAWRGLAIFILYIWVLGFDLYCFQRYKISHRLTFHFNDHHYSTSAQIFRLAGLFTAMFLVLFLIYLLHVAEVFNLNSSNFRAQYLALMGYIALFTYLFIPLPIFNHRGRLYMWKLFVRSLLSPIIGVDFTIIWMTDQWQSLTTPLRDLAYSICYYTRLDFDQPKKNECKDASTFEVALLVIIIAVTYRILQCLRIGYDQGWLCQPHMFNTIKYGFSLASAVLAYSYKLNSDLFPAWLAISIISTIYAYFWDLKMDWALLTPNCRNWLLRKYITFEPKRNYYVIMVLNLLLRLSWTITLSPAIISLFGDANLLSFATGSAEIFRRGIWNLLRVEKEHLVNCNDFKAVPDMKTIQDKLEEGLLMETEVDVRNKEHAKNRQVVRKEFLELIREKIAHREEGEKDFGQEYEEEQLRRVKKYSKQIKQILNPKKVKGE